MPQRLGLESSLDSHAQAPVFAPGEFPEAKPQNPSDHAFLPLEKLTSEHEAELRPATPDLLYLFLCGIKWHKFGETESGWELVQAMRSGYPGARAFAAELLADTENGRLLVRDLRRTRSGLYQITTVTRTAAPAEQLGKGEDMNTPYGLEIVENCMTCKLRKNGWFCHFSPDLLKSFSAFSHLTTYPGGAILFVEGQTARGAFVLCSGKVKLSTTSREGKVLI